MVNSIWLGTPDEITSETTKNRLDLNDAMATSTRIIESQADLDFTGSECSAPGLESRKRTLINGSGELRDRPGYNLLRSRR